MLHDCRPIAKAGIKGRWNCHGGLHDGFSQLPAHRGGEEWCGRWRRMKAMRRQGLWSLSGCLQGCKRQKKTNGQQPAGARLFIGYVILRMGLSSMEPVFMVLASFRPLLRRWHIDHRQYRCSRWMKTRYTPPPPHADS